MDLLERLDIFFQINTRLSIYNQSAALLNIVGNQTPNTTRSRMSNTLVYNFTDIQIVYYSFFSTSNEIPFLLVASEYEDSNHARMPKDDSTWPSTKTEWSVYRIEQRCTVMESHIVELIEVQTCSI